MESLFLLSGYYYIGSNIKIHSYRNCVYRSARHNSRKRSRRYVWRMMPNRHRTSKYYCKPSTTQRSRLPASRSGERSYGVPFSKTIKSRVNSLQIIRWPARGGEGRGGEGERAAQKRELPRLGRPFDFQLHRARRCAKLIRCVSIFARKPANVTQRAAKPISITTQSRNISKIVVPRISQLRGSFPSYAEGRGKGAAGRGRDKKRTDVYIAARILVDLGSISCELRATYSGHATRFSTLLQLCNTSAAPSEAKRRATLFKYRARSLNFRTGSLREEICARNYARLLPWNNVWTSCPCFFIHSFYVSGLRTGK